MTPEEFDTKYDQLVEEALKNLPPANDYPFDLINIPIPTIQLRGLDYQPDPSKSPEFHTMTFKKFKEKGSWYWELLT